MTHSKLIREICVTVRRLGERRLDCGFGELLLPTVLAARPPLSCRPHYKTQNIRKSRRIGKCESQLKNLKINQKSERQSKCESQSKMWTCVKGTYVLVCLNWFGSPVLGKKGSLPWMPKLASTVERREWRDQFEKSNIPTKKKNKKNPQCLHAPKWSIPRGNCIGTWLDSGIWERLAILSTG